MMKTRNVVAGVVEVSCTCCTDARELIHHVQLGPTRMVCPATGKTYLDRGDGIYQPDGEAMAAIATPGGTAAAPTAAAAAGGTGALGAGALAAGTMHPGRRAPAPAARAAAVMPAARPTADAGDSPIANTVAELMNRLAGSPTEARGEINTTPTEARGETTPASDLLSDRPARTTEKQRITLERATFAAGAAEPQ